MIEVYIQPRTAITNEDIEEDSRVHVPVLRSGKCGCSYWFTHFNNSKHFILHLSAQHFVLHCHRVFAVDSVRCLRDAAAVVEPPDSVHLSRAIHHSYTTVNLGVSVILFPLSPTPIYFVHFILELLLIYIAFQLKYRLVDLVIHIYLQDDLWFIPSSTEISGQIVFQRTEFLLFGLLTLFVVCCIKSMSSQLGIYPYSRHSATWWMFFVDHVFRSEVQIFVSSVLTYHRIYMEIYLRFNTFILTYEGNYHRSERRIVLLSFVCVNGVSSSDDSKLATERYSLTLCTTISKDVCLLLTE